MLRTLLYSAAIAALTFAVAFVGFSAWRSFYQEPQRTNNSSPDASAQQQPDNVAATKSSDDAIATYTLLLAIFTGVLSVVAIVQIGFLIRADTVAGKSAGAAKQSADALVAGQRAFVYWEDASFRTALKSPPPIPHGRYAILETPHEKVGEIEISLTNGGGTTTHGLKSIFVCAVMRFDQIPLEPFSIFHRNEESAIPNVIAPKQVIRLPPCQVTMEDIELANNNGRAIFLLGEVRYADLVDNKTVRRTQFSRRVRITGFDEKAGTFSATAYTAGRHNCADDECPD